MVWTIKADEAAEKARLNDLIFQRLQILEEAGIDQYDAVWGDKLMEGSGLFESGDLEGAEQILKDVMEKNKLGGTDGLDN